MGGPIEWDDEHVASDDAFARDQDALGASVATGGRRVTRDGQPVAVEIDGEWVARLPASGDVEVTLAGTWRRIRWGRVALISPEGRVVARFKPSALRAVHLANGSDHG